MLDKRAVTADPLPRPRPHAASYRDPAGFVFTNESGLYRQVNEAGRKDYEALMSSGLYAELAKEGDMVSHEDVEHDLSPDGRAAYVIRPERVSSISYPYEWCFSQLKDAALLTLRLQKAALAHGMSLKDATPFNVAFSGGRPVWIDTLSFETLPPGAPWVAYGQFCQMFLAPLALMAQVDVRLQGLLRACLDGIPLDLASALLPKSTWLRPGLLMHLHLHAAAQRRSAATATRGRTAQPVKPRIGQAALAGLVDSLTATVERLGWELARTTWGNYYADTNYTEDAFAHKREIVAGALDRLAPTSVWDLGGNDGTFSRLASSRGVPTVCFDLDPAAVEKNYRQAKAASETALLPLLLDLVNPSAPSGWANEERDSLAARGPVDLVFALALVHHLAIGHNVPLERIAGFLSRLTRALVIEFVPKEDSQVQRLLASRVDIFDTYTVEHFEESFAPFFDVMAATRIRGSARTIYVMRRRDG